MDSKRFEAVVKHQTGWAPLCGTFEFVVKPSPGKDGCWYVTAKGFGCSRDYRSTPENAIRSLLAEHACSATSITEI